MSKRKTDKEFKKEVFELVGDEYTFYGDYENNRTKFLVYHKTCDKTFETTPHSFLRGTRCHYCRRESSGRSRRKTNEQFIKEVTALVGDEYVFIDKYVNTRTKIRSIHKECGEIYEVTPHNFLRGARCKDCSYTLRGDKLRKTQDE